MTFFRLLLASLALAVLYADGACAGDADYRATLQRVSAMAPPQRQRWLLELESRLDAATRKVLTRQQAAEQRNRVYKFLRQKVVPRDELVELMRLADQREQTARALAARPDPLEFLRKSIIRRDPQSPLPTPVPSTGLPQRHGVAIKIDSSAILHTDPGEFSPPTVVPRLAADIVPRRFGDSVGDLGTRTTDKLGRWTIDLPIEADRVVEEPSTTVGALLPRVAARTDISRREPGTAIKPRRPAHSVVDPGIQHTFTPPTPPEGSPARLAQGGTPTATDAAAAGVPVARTVLKPPIPPDGFQPPVESPLGLPKTPSSSRKPPVISVNLSELSARVTGTNLALRTLEAELDNKADLTVGEIKPVVDRLVKLVARRNDLALYMDVISSRERARAGRLESSRTVILQLQSHIDFARAVAAGPQFSGSASDRQAVLRQLDELSRTLGEL